MLLFVCLLHYTGHIFPVGFKCIRQEHDALLDKVVDIHCEIDAMSEDTKQIGSGTSNNYQQSARTLVPLFRVTVAWEIKGKQVVRVYEARSPQQAWQAAVLEKIGIESNLPGENDVFSPSSVTEKIEEGEDDDEDKEREKEKLEREKEKEREREREKEKERNSRVTHYLPQHHLDKGRK